MSLLADGGIEYLFGNPGTTELAIMDALSQQPEISYVLGLQESIVVAMADGYAHASNRLSACNVHVAPGLGNAMGALYSAKFYGSPLIVTAGEQEQGHGLMEPMLYDPLVPIAQPLVKWAVEVSRLQDLPRIVRRAAKIAMSPPTGPVFISLPGDILDAQSPLDLGASAHGKHESQMRAPSMTQQRAPWRRLPYSSRHPDACLPDSSGSVRRQPCSMDGRGDGKADEPGLRGCDGSWSYSSLQRLSGNSGKRRGTFSPV